MAMFRNFRLNKGRSVLRKRVSRMKKRVTFRENISRAKTMGIVWDASNPDDFVVLSRFHQKMNERKIDLKIIGYYPGKELPDRITAIRYLTCIKQQDLNYFFRPVSKEADHFIKTPFDILIDLNFKNIFPLEYISSLSNAGFKVGVFKNNYLCNPFDLMMEVRIKTDLEDYLNQVIHYLEMINTGRTRTNELILNK
jgi:hypothetical protein